MKTRIFILHLIILILPTAAIAVIPPPFLQNDHIPHEIVVKFKDSVSKKKITEMNNKNSCKVMYTSPFAGFKRIKTPLNHSPADMVELYACNAEVEYAELNYCAHKTSVPNDPLYSLQWNFSDPNSGINIESAWDITTGNSNVIVAVIDTGIAYENYKGFTLAPDLANTNFVQGYDFHNDDEHPNDDEGHGTHITGTIAQSTKNSLGTAGVAYNCSIMPVKVLSNFGSGSHVNIADGIYFAADNNVNVINLSLGGPSSTTLENAISYAYNKGVTINSVRHGVCSL